MTDLERARDDLRRKGYCDGHMADIIDAHLEEDAAELTRLREELSKSVSQSFAHRANLELAEEALARLRECCADHAACEAAADAHMDELRANLYQAQRQVKVSEAELARLRPMEHKYAEALEREAVLDIENARLREDTQNLRKALGSVQYERLRLEGRQLIEENDRG